MRRRAPFSICGPPRAYSKETLKNSGNYGILSIDNTEMTLQVANPKSKI